jgi:alginate O-acetyltransferase complex protein AlgI
MLFNSASFALFLPIVFLLYWKVFNKNLLQQNGLLLISSYFFYACWDWRFLFLLMFSTFLDYFTGIKMHKAAPVRNRKIWLWVSVCINLGFLGTFKYYDFFVTSFAEGLANLGFHANPVLLNLVLPVGISFYTFHGLSYVIDIYKKRIEPEYNFIVYSVFVSFFPLLVAGPIERATHLLPQVKKERTFSYSQAVDGLRQIIWGLFKKVVIADNCAEYVNVIFADPTSYNGSTYLLGAIFFAFQIYGDFSGYSDIAIGTAKLFGIDLLRNFAFPYFSRDIAEFWRRWHISLSSWFRDYLYIPLGGSKGGKLKRIGNVFVIFLVSGFWHGANWTFVLWGFLNALYILPSIFFKTNRNNLNIVAQGKYLPNLRELGSVLLTFSLTVIAWIFFRSTTVTEGFVYLGNIFSMSLFEMPSIRPTNIILLLLGFVVVEWISREKHHPLQFQNKVWRPLRFIIYLVICFSVLFNHRYHQESEFIYFQF